MPYISSSLFRRQIGLLLSLRKIHENSRYYQRIPHSSHYENHDYLFLRSSLLPSTDDKIIKTLHMNRAEFTSVVALFGDDDIFKSQGRKPQAPPKVQLATCIYRMAGGESIRTVQNHFNLSHGSVSLYTERSLIAIVSSLKKYISWPSGEERAVIARELYAQYGIPSCVGFIDGTDIVLHQAPTVGSEKAHTMQCYEERDGYFKLIAVVDHLKRFRYGWFSYSAVANDQMAQGQSDLHGNPDRFFSPKEYVLGDAGMKSSDTVIPLFKRERRQVGHKVSLFPTKISTDSSRPRPTSTINVRKLK